MICVTYGLHGSGSSKSAALTSSLGRSERRGFSSSVAPGGPIPPELEIETVMSYPPVLPQCKNYLGAGAACARDSSGRYYALLPVTDADVNHAWMTWAASTDGKDWWFLPHTKDPLTSFPLIAHADLGECCADGVSLPPCPVDRYGHAALCYDPTTDKFLASFGYNGTQGSTATYFEIDRKTLAVSRKDGAV